VSDGTDPGRVSPRIAQALPELAAGTELIGEYRGSGFREPPYLVRRADGQVLQVPRLLYLVAADLDGRRDAACVADRVSGAVGRRLSAEDVEYLVRERLAPAGVVASRRAAANPLPLARAPLALRWRAPAIPPRVVGAIAGALRPLFLPPVVVAVVAGLAAIDAWLVAGPGIGPGIRALAARPALALGLLGLLIVGALFHECGHATACRYGGARPGAIGAGVYFMWPVVYTDVTDSYRLDRGGRLRTDLGGVYFNAVFCLVLAGVWAVTGFAPLLLLVAVQQLQMLGQFTPWVRLDGYYVVCDLTGVPDVFSRLRPALRGMRRGRPPDPRAAELTPRARRLLLAYLGVTVPVILFVTVRLSMKAPDVLTHAGGALVREARTVGAALEAGQMALLASAALQTALLSLPVVLAAVTLARVGRRAGRAALRR